MVKILPAEICGYSYQQCKNLGGESSLGPARGTADETNVLTSLKAEVSLSV